MKRIYTPHVYKFVISPYYANYSLFSKVANDDTEDWKMVANGASGKGIVKRMVLAEIEKIFEQYDYVTPPSPSKGLGELRKELDAHK